MARVRGTSQRHNGTRAASVGVSLPCGEQTEVDSYTSALPFVGADTSQRDTGLPARSASKHTSACAEAPWNRPGWQRHRSHRSDPHTNRLDGYSRPSNPRHRCLQQSGGEERSTSCHRDLTGPPGSTFFLPSLAIRSAARALRARSFTLLGGFHLAPPILLGFSLGLLRSGRIRRRLRSLLLLLLLRLLAAAILGIKFLGWLLTLASEGRCEQAAPRLQLRRAYRRRHRSGPQIRP